MFLQILEAGKFLLDGAGALLGQHAQNAAASATRRAAQDAFSETSRALSLRADQEAQAAAQQVHALSQDTAYSRGALGANAASANVEGNTVNALDADLLSREFNARDVVTRNLAMTDDNIAQARRSAQAEAQSRINGAPAANPLATGLQLGGSLLAFGYDWMKLHPPTDTKTV